MVRYIKTNPTKEFFIYMITRDIDIKDAILELVDNAIDGAIRIRPKGHFNDLIVKINLSENEFSISDNCGGIPIDIAENYAFRFGRPKEAKGIDYSTGIFGIGMKRALFKLGKKFSIESVEEHSCFSVNIDVEKWASNDDKWNFEFDEAEENCNNDILNCGTKIVVKQLHEGIKNNLKLDFFRQELILHIGQYVSMSIEKGLNVFINDIKLVPIMSGIYIESKFLTPAYLNYTVSGVKIQIMAGIGERKSPDKAGWYVYCNGRLVLSADKSQISGWEEDNTPKFHPTYARFRGFVFFESRDAKKLPWNTTKTNVDTANQIFISAKSKMKIIFKSVADVLKRVKNIDIEDKREEIEELLDGLRIYSVSPLKLKDLPIENFVDKVSGRFVNELPKPSNSEVTISYKRNINEVEKVKEIIGVTSNKEVGEKTFNYFFKRECQD